MNQATTHIKLEEARYTQERALAEGKDEEMEESCLPLAICFLLEICTMALIAFFLPFLPR